DGIQEHGHRGRRRGAQGDRALQPGGGSGRDGVHRGADSPRPQDGRDRREDDGGAGGAGVQEPHGHPQGGRLGTRPDREDQRVPRGHGRFSRVERGVREALPEPQAAADVRVLIGPDPQHGNLVARYRGTGTAGKPIIVFAHLDVVPARRADWSVDPFTFLEKDGYFYGRGTTDNKAGDATLVADFIRLRRAGFRPRRDLILVLTGDEETAGSCMTWLVTKHRELIDAEFALNTDAGGGVLRDGRKVAFAVQASEKVYATYVLEATDKGGHSSLPRPADNPLYRLAPVLERLAQYQFPVKLNEVSRAFFEQSAAIDTGRLAEDMRGVLKDPPDSGAVARLAAVP